MKICFDIGGMSTKLAVIDDKKIFIEQQVINYSEYINKNELINIKLLSKLMIKQINELLKRHKINYIGISMPGCVNPVSGDVTGLAAIQDLDKLNLKILFEEKFNIKTYVCNDAKCATLIELKQGSGVDVDNFISIIIGTGIGGTVVIDKKIYYGKNRMAGEFGYFINDKIGDNDSYINYSNLYGMYTLENKYFNQTKKQLSGKEIYDLYFDDSIAKQIIDEMIMGIAKLIFNNYFVLDFEKVIIGGAISQNNLFMELLIKQVEKYFNKAEVEHPFEIVACKYLADANLLGASILD